MARGPRPAAKPGEAEAVVAFLRANPGFLAEHPDLYRELVPPRRMHGEVLADHMAAMLQAARAESAALQDRADRVLEAGRASAGLAARVQDAVLALIGAADPVACVTEEFPALLAVDVVVLRDDLSAAAVSYALRSRAAAFGTADPDWFGEAASLVRHSALARVPSRQPAILALGARDAGVLDGRQGIGALIFLGRAVAAALDAG